MNEKLKIQLKELKWYNLYYKITAALIVLVILCVSIETLMNLSQEGVKREHELFVAICGLSILIMCVYAITMEHLSFKKLSPEERIKEAKMHVRWPLLFYLFYKKEPTT